MNIKVLVADDHRLVRQGLVQLLDAEDDMTVVGEAADGEEACLKAKLLKPDVVVMDVSMPRLNGVEATRVIRQELPQTGVIILTMHRREDLVFQALKAGAKGFFLKESDSKDLIDAIRIVHGQGATLDAEMAVKLIDEFRRLNDPQQGDYVHLTDREREILELLAKGADNRQISNALNISEKTVRNRLSAIFDKLHVNNRTQAALYAIREGLSEGKTRSP